MKPYYDDGAVQIYHGDCREVLPLLASVDAVITDPPYSEHVHGKSRQGSRPLSGSVSGGSFSAPANFCREKEFGFDALTQEVREFVAGWVAVNCRRWSLVFSDVESSGDWRRDLTLDGRVEYVRTGAWVKVGCTPQFNGDRPAVGFEAITICHPKGQKRWNGGGTHAVWSVPIVLNRGVKVERVHETQKPEALMSRLVVLFTDPGEIIADPFMGSGTTLVAAKRLGRKAIGIEAREKDCESAAERLAQGALDLFGEASA